MTATAASAGVLLVVPPGSPETERLPLAGWSKSGLGPRGLWARPSRLTALGAPASTSSSGSAGCARRTPACTFHVVRANHREVGHFFRPHKLASPQLPLSSDRTRSLLLEFPPTSSSHLLSPPLSSSLLLSVPNQHHSRGVSHELACEGGVER